MQPTAPARKQGQQAAFAACPSTPQEDTPEAVGFKRQKMVRWFTPRELVRSGIKAVLSSLFGAYADKRELQALQATQAAQLATNRAGRSGSETATSTEGMADLAAGEVCDFSAQNEIWVDYISDVGDGFDSTYTMARLLAMEELPLASAAGEVVSRRGQVLVMGGDQVYPTATREEYGNRLVGPYRSALPCVPDETKAPHLFAVPGNHDWYDGLTSFSRLFCHERWIGGWKTEQRRSYFAIRLPHDWWIWGIDVQLASDIDLPQLEYFDAIAGNEALMPSGSKIILCTAEPSWVYSRQKGPIAYRNLAFFEKHVIDKYGHEHVVGLAGDLHTYARYEEKPPAGHDGHSKRRKQRFISGGGGAYLYPSHQLPEELYPLEGLPPELVPEGREGECFSCRSDVPEHLNIFPERKTSRILAFGALKFPFINFTFSMTLGALYLFFTWITQSAGKHPAIPSELSLLEYFFVDGLWRGLGHFLVILKHSPGTVLIVLLLWGGLVGLADKKGLGKVVLGSVHTLGHIALALVLMWIFAWLNLGALELGAESIVQIALFTIEMLLFGSLAAGLLMGAYLLLSNVLLTSRSGLHGVHANEVFSCQALPDYKNFLRLHVDAAGRLTIYPIGVRKVCRTWRLNSNAGIGEPWFEPEDGSIAARAEAIEPPIVLAK